MATSAWTPVDETAAKWTPVDEARPDFAANPPPAAGPHVDMQPVAGTDSLNIPRSMSLGPGQPEKDPNLATAGAAGIALGIAGPTVARKALPYVAPAVASYAINKARELPVVGPIIEHIPYAEMLPWMMSGKGKEAAEEQAPVRGSIAKGFKDAGGPLPEAPPAEFFQGRGLSEGGRPGVDPAAGLGKVPVRGSIAESFKTPETTPAAQQSAAPPPAPAPTPRGSIRKMMQTAQSSLEDGLGAVKPRVIPGKPIYQRGGIAQEMKSASAEVPASDPTELLEGHTPTESSWIKSYKYDPAKREFEMHPKSGNAVRLGDVSPEDAKAFSDSDSKGTAWQQMKRNPPVAKRVNGQWVTIPRAGVTSSP